MNDNAILVEHLSKTFRIPHENRDTIKERLFNFPHAIKYETYKALDNISLTVKKGEFFGIIGRNGSGKSTLLKILAGIYTPDEGNVVVEGEISPFLELGVGFNPELSGKDNIYLNATILGISKKEIEKKYKAIVDFSELEQFIDLKLKNYSSGMYVRLAFAVAIHANKGILLMDEVLAVGDASFQAKCISEFNHYKAIGNTVILVTHDIGTVRRYCDRAILLEHGRILKMDKAEEVCEEYEFQNMTEDEKIRYLEEKEKRVAQNISTEQIKPEDKTSSHAQEQTGSGSNISLDKDRSAVPEQNNLFMKSEAGFARDDRRSAYLIKSLYQGLLGRDADPNGLSFWLNEVNNGMNDETLFTSILNSEESYRRFNQINTGSRKAQKSEESSDKIRNARNKLILTKISPELKILNGPFKGIKYPSITISELALLPKIVGSYESCLHPVIQRIISTPYSDIINIGSAEGYYAVGLAREMPHSIVHCYDINEEDIKFCREMAKINKLSNLTFNTVCSPEILRNFHFKVRGLILCDCEGCELELFSKDVIEDLKNVDVLMELHDIINPVISAEMLTRFQNTHHIQIINNINQDTSQFIGLEKLSEEERVYSLYEHRGGINNNVFMEWAFLTFNNTTPDSK